MAIDEAQYCERVRRLAFQRGKVLDLADIRDSLPGALDALALDVYYSGDYPLLEVEFSLPLTLGVCSLASQSDVMIATIETVKHPNFDGFGTASFFSRIPNGTRADLAQSRNTIFPPYVLEKNALYLSLGQGIWPDIIDLPPDTASLAITAQGIPAISAVTFQLEDRLIEHGVVMAIGIAEAKGGGEG